MARRACTFSSVYCSEERAIWVGELRELFVQIDGHLVVSRASDVMLAGLFRQRLAAEYWELAMLSHDLFADGALLLELFVKVGLVLDEALESGFCAVDLGRQLSSTFLQLIDRCIGC